MICKTWNWRKKGKKANITDILYYYEEFSPDSLVNLGITYNDKYTEEK